MYIYKLTIEQTIEYEYETTTVNFYLTEEEMKRDRANIEISNKKDGKWIPNITSIYFNEEKISFEEAKNEMTIAQYEELFNTKIGENLC